MNVADILLIRAVPVVDGRPLARRLRTLLADAAIVDASLVRRMITRSTADSAGHGDDRDTLFVSRSLVASFLSAGYSPVVVVGPFLSEDLRSFIGAFPERRVMSVSLYMSDESLLQRLLAERDRQNYRIGRSPDILGSAKARRLLEQAQLAPARHLNDQIYATRHETDLCIDTSSRDADSTAGIILTAAFPSALEGPRIRRHGNPAATQRSG